MGKLLVKKGAKLSEAEVDQINQAKAREFKAPPLQKKRPGKRSVFFVRRWQKNTCDGAANLCWPN